MSSEQGYYLYGVIAGSEQKEFGTIGIGGRGDVVYTLPHRDIAALISTSPIVKYPVSRDNVTAHTNVLEQAVKEHTVLPVRFCTIAANQEMIVEKFLQPRYQELIGLLATMQGKLELAVRARWLDLNAIFAEVVEESKEIKALKAAALQEKNAQRKYASQIKIGELVQKALINKRKREAHELLDALRPFSMNYKEQQIYGDMNIINAAFLVPGEKERDFDQKLDELEAMYSGRKQLHSMSTAVPYNFVELVVHW